jgi:hypothetical protein
MSKFNFLLVTVFLTLSSPVLAEESHHVDSSAPPPSASQPASQMPGGMMTNMMPMMTMMQEVMAPEHVEGRIAFLRTELGVTDQQLTQWETFADALREMANHAGKSASMMDGAMMSSNGQTHASLMDRISRQEDVLKGQLQELQHLQAALAPLYASLSDAQKKTADELFMLCPMCSK